MYETREAMQKLGALRLSECIKLSKTIAFADKCERARKTLESFISKVSNPIISCGGGKDSTATAILARQVCPHIPVVCANPPNPLSDRTTHLNNLKNWLGGEFVEIDYNWDVGAVLAGEKKYPQGLKMRVLSNYHRENKIDGVIMGLRQSESKSRRIIFRGKGTIYQTQKGWRCIPVAEFTAEEVLCVALKHDAPINPVYTRQSGNFPFELIRDGTWWPHGYTDMSQWIKEYYPEHYEDHMRAKCVYDGRKSYVCQI